MTIHHSYFKLAKQLSAIYDEREAANIADMVIEKITGKTKSQRIIDKEEMLPAGHLLRLQGYTKRLLQHEPVQYVVGEAWFAGMKFFVDANVLIPRPETEELVELIIKEVKHKPGKNTLLLDIGTGSGCIPVALKKKNQSFNITAIDVSEGALQVAIKNADGLNANITFMRLNFLNEDEWEQLPQFDIIVSNPPYIQQGEQIQMNENVTRYEPHLALFVPDDDALLFYKKIAFFGRQHLIPGGKIFVEINEALGEKTKNLFTANGYNAGLYKDLQGKDRMLMAWLQ
jgi:protein-(glutamine-N5) methyltransferase, release factor-specific